MKNILYFEWFIECFCRLKNNEYASLATKATVINVSSLAAIQPFESWGVYCAGKAARDMFHKVLAEEQKKSPARESIRVLSYAPGPLDTNMQKEIRESALVDKPTQDYFIELKKNNQLVDPTVSADKLINLIASENFESGTHVDFFDI
jgi:sepiapterin reductase